MKKQWLTQKEVRELEDISLRAVGKRIKKGKYPKTREVAGKGGRGGVRTEIHVSCLSETARATYFGSPEPAPELPEIQNLKSVEASLIPHDAANASSNPPSGDASAGEEPTPSPNPSHQGRGARQEGNSRQDACAPRVKDFWITPQEAAKLTQQSARNVRRKYTGDEADPEKFRIQPDGKHKYLIHAHALPAQAQWRFYREKDVTVPEYLQKRLADSLDDVPRADREHAYQWYNILNQFDVLGQHWLNRTLQERAQDFCSAYRRDELFQKVKVTPTGLLKKQRIYAREGIRSLLPKRREGKSRIETSRAAKDFLYQHYLHQGRGSKALAARATLAKAEQEEWIVPGERTLIRLLDNIPKPIVVLYREGLKAYTDKVLPSGMRDYDPIRPMDMWCSDHHQIDVEVFYGKRRLFPWLTIWQDMKSRKIMAWVVSAQPNSDVIAYCLHRAVKRYGIPQNVLIDNGKDYKSRRLSGRQKPFKLLSESEEVYLRGGFQALGIEAHFALPYNAKSKPAERFFRRLEEQCCCQLPGYRGSNTTQKPEKLEKERKEGTLLKIDELEALLGRWIEESYHTTTHLGHGMYDRSPNQVFETERIEAGYASQEHLRFLLLKVAGGRKVQRNGIELFESWYRDSDLQFKYLGKKVWVRYDKDDLSKIYVYSAEKDVFLGEAQRITRAGVANDEESLKAVKREHKRSKQREKEYYGQFDKENAPTLEERIVLPAEEVAVATPKKAAQAAGRDAKIVRLPPKPGLSPINSGVHESEPPEQEDHELTPERREEMHKSFQRAMQKTPKELEEERLEVWERERLARYKEKLEKQLKGE